MKPLTVKTALTTKVMRDACFAARDWLSSLPEGTTARQAWQQCTRPDWMFWLLGRRRADHVKLVRCACEIARTVLHMVPAGEDRPRLAIEAAERWCNDPTEANKSDAANAANDAYDAADNARTAADAYAYAAASAASRAAVYASAASRVDDAAAARAAAAAVYAVDDAAANADAVSSAASAASRAASRADIIRRHFPAPPRLRGEP